MEVLYPQPGDVPVMRCLEESEGYGRHGGEYVLQESYAQVGVLRVDVILAVHDLFFILCGEVERSLEILITPSGALTHQAILLGIAFAR